MSQSTSDHVLNRLSLDKGWAAFNRMIPFQLQSDPHFPLETGGLGSTRFESAIRRWTKGAANWNGVWATVTNRFVAANPFPPRLIQLSTGYSSSIHSNQLIMDHGPSWLTPRINDELIANSSGIIHGLRCQSMNQRIWIFKFVQLCWMSDLTTLLTTDTCIEKTNPTD